MPFIQTSWTQDDELTSARLQTMSSNDDYLYSLTPQKFYTSYQPCTDSGDGTGLAGMRGRTQGEFPNTKILAVFGAFDFNFNTSFFTFAVFYPAGLWTNAPIVTCTVAGAAEASNFRNQLLCSYISEDFRTDRTLITVFYPDLIARPYHGVVHLHAVGA